MLKYVSYWLNVTWATLYLIDRIYPPPRKASDQGHIQLEIYFKTSTTGLKKYFETTPDKYLEAALKHVNTKFHH